jgi:hypothetical protein
MQVHPDPIGSHFEIQHAPNMEVSGCGPNIVGRELHRDRPESERRTAVEYAIAEARQVWDGAMHDEVDDLS